MGAAAIKLRRTAGDLREIPRSAAIAAAKAVKAIAKEEAARVSGGDGKLNAGTRRGVPLKARDEITVKGRTTFVRVYGVGGGWVWVNTGTRPHEIRRRKKGPMRKMTVHHPGTRGAGAWRRVVKRAKKIVPEIYADELHAAVTK